MAVTKHKKLVNEAVKRRRFLVKELKALHREAETRAAKRKYSPFPYSLFEQGVAHMLDVFENKWLFKRWAKGKLKQ